MNTNTEIINRCDNVFCPELATEIEFNDEVWSDIQELFWYFWPEECAVFLLGENTDDKILITDYCIPKQKVYMGYVEIEEVAPSNVIGHLHSHGSIAPFFSDTDLDHLNYPVHVVIGTGTPVAIVRTELSCGHLMQRPAKIIILAESQ
jgi:proteasome lid subunit RPN8/RPN11